MNPSFHKLLMEKTGFPAQARQALLQAGERLRAAGQEPAFDGAVAFYSENAFDAGMTQPLAEALAEAAGLSPYTMWALLLMEAAGPARAVYAGKGVPEEVFWDTFADLKYKALECQAVHGVWGNFVAFWYPIFFTGDIVKLGRLEFEDIAYPWDTPYQGRGVRLEKGDPVKNIHIPSSGEPFDLAARLDSYKKAWEFFRREGGGGPLVCLCHSWLLYPQNREILAPGSHIVDFARDFDLVGWEESGAFSDSWRVFGAAASHPVSQWPEDTSMRRGFKNWLLSGKKTGEGWGVLVFDREKLLTGDRP